ncbi:hypothetical protein [Leifsonia sp. 1010]|uniref:hypothetical protein n=1 Tax=Leifsonia sp. 1010 TaxID=2817769 RepID=UPI002864A545|nr:hypothetical protein [Leifsonia sp. 1010]MDR6611446.1 hypothetical protein [Leifsonia sp. 1010]
MPQPGINTPYDGLSTKPKAQLLDEALQHVNDVAQLVGGDWLDVGTPPVAFDPANAEQRDAWHRAPCDDRATTHQYDVNVRQLAGPSEFDPDALSEKVRTYWLGLGYRVRQIGPAAQDSGGHRSIIVDLPHSASVSFSANTEILGISASSECGKWD